MASYFSISRLNFHTLFFILYIFSHTTPTESSSTCNQTCGSTTVYYPFGFSAGCKIQLKCSKAGTMELAGFTILNFTPNATILLDVGQDCNRSSNDINGLYGDNYALTNNNILILNSCKNPLADSCNLNSEKLSPKLDSINCRGEKGNITCFSRRDNPDKRWLKMKNSSLANCRDLYIIVRYGKEHENHTNLEFGTAEVGWWVDGGCRCAKNAKCSQVTTPGKRTTGFWCSCDEGFTGDGFADGWGCTQRCKPSSYLTGKCRGKRGIALLFGGIVALTCLLFGAMFLICYIRRHRAILKHHRNTRKLLYQSSCSVPVYTFKEIEFATSNFSDTLMVGTGAYGTVYKGKLRDINGLVAIKRLTKHGDVDQVVNEIKLISSVSHPSLVQLLGCCIYRGEQILIYEFVPNGTLTQHLHRELGQGLPWPSRLSIATETAKAIAYLHNAVQPSIYHRDIKSSNILLDENLRPKLADFGLSRTGTLEFSKTHISTVPQGTPGYIDPQYHQNFHLTDKSDVYSFGVVLVEMITAMKVVDLGRAGAEVNLAALAVDRIAEGLLDEIVDPFIKQDERYWPNCRKSVHKFAELAFRCLAFHRDMRPSMSEVEEELEDIRNEWFSSEQSEVMHEQGGELGVQRVEAKSSVEQSSTTSSGSMNSVNF